MAGGSWRRTLLGPLPILLVGASVALLEASCGSGDDGGFICRLGGACYTCPTQSQASQCSEMGPGAARCETAQVTCPAE